MPRQGPTGTDAHVTPRLWSGFYTAFDLGQWDEAGTVHTGPHLARRSAQGWEPRLERLAAARFFRLSVGVGGACIYTPPFFVHAVGEHENCAPQSFQNMPWRISTGFRPPARCNTIHIRNLICIKL